MTQFCLTTYHFPSFTHTTGMTHFLDLRKRLLKIKCLSGFPLQLLSESFLIPRRTAHGMIMNVHSPVLGERYPCQILIKLSLAPTYFSNIQISNTTKIPSVGTEFFQVDGRTD